MKEIDRLEKKGKINERDHQLLRSSALVSDELTHLTLGEDDSLTEETVTQIFERISNEIRKEESEKLDQEQMAHQRTHDALYIEQTRNQQFINNLYWQYHRWAKILAWIPSAIIGLALVISLAGLELSSANPFLGQVFGVSSIISGLLTLTSLLFGFTAKGLHKWVQKRCLTWLLKRASKNISVNWGEFDMNLN